MITATAWVPRGHAAAHPTKYEFDEEEYERIAKLAKMELEEAKEGLEEAKQALNEDGEGASVGASKEKKDEDDQLDEDDDLKEYDMEHYDDDEEDDEAGSQDGEDGGLFGNVKSLAYHADNKDDPYITLQENDASDDEEREELQIMPTDNMVLAARV